MPTTNGDTLPFGLNHILPTTAKTAWGARLIVSQDGYVDFVGDRQGCAGEDRDAFLDLMGQQFPIDKLREAIGDLLRSGRMNTRVAEDFTIFSSDEIQVCANTNGSAGYCYIAAFLHKGVTV